MKLASISFKSNGYVWLVGTTVICLASVVLFYNFILTKQLAKKGQAVGQLCLVNSKVATVERFAAEHPDKERYLQDLNAEVIRVNKLLPDRLNMGETVAFLEDTAKVTGVVCGAITTEKSVFNNGWTENRLVLKVLGDYSDLMEFARRLDAGPRFMAVRAVEFHDRVVLGQKFWGQKEIEQLVEKELSGKASSLVKPVIERGLLNKESLLVMNVYLMVASEGRLPDVQSEQDHPAK
ncbi:MAG: Pilus assembly protein, PilO [Firmicutes bacterium]|nr:Pilus assembly protein, PilO [Bacillota bacterium]